MSKKRRATPKGRKTKPQKRSISRKIAAFLLKLSLVGLVLGGVGLFVLDQHIRMTFEGKRWALPAKVYARPLDLYEGLELDRTALRDELKGLGYRFVNRARQPGEVEWARTRMRIYTRGFDFPDGPEQSGTYLLEFDQNQLRRITDRYGQETPLFRLEPVLIGGIYPAHNEDRDLIRLADAPTLLTRALVEVEDKDFYQHYGVSLRGIARAMWVNLREGRFAQGGSTLTQQLIKNFYLTSDRSLWRKALEIPMALLLDRRYSKDEILEAYLNEVYLGQSGSRAIHGFGLASHYYFARPISELELHQVALLAGLVKGPSFYDPRRHPERSKQRRDLVLQVMADAGVISAEAMKQAQTRSLGVVKEASLLKGAYPAYLDLVKRQLRQEYPEEILSSEGLRVFTSLNPQVQSKAEQSMVATLAQLEKRYGNRANGVEGGMVVTDPQTGEVLAVVGGRQTRYQGFNRALDAKRPIGSLVKPALYLAGLEEGYTLASLLDDAPIAVTLEDGSLWQPKNFDGSSHGQVPLHYALAHSYNLSSAYLGMQIGVDRVVEMLHRLGAEGDIPPLPSLLLGAHAMSPYELAGIYQTLAAGGYRIPPKAIRRVTDANNQELSRYPFEIRQVVSPDKMHLIQYALQEVVREGTATHAYSRLSGDLNLAGKTGTSNDQRDSWFAGYAGNRLAVVWLGYDNNRPLPFTGSGGALRVWTDYMAREQLEPFFAPAPQGIEYRWIDGASGLLATEACEGARALPFRIGKAPTDRAPCAPAEQRTLSDWFQRWFREE